ncbi:hypothetical protein GLOIN_2v1845965 [Rhizophagus irregularis DAOM 181602=DAOM 197198]|uniref:Uncharacterized protein n=1 Tax=Rhizophagus irregularis (strain DAOM 181602 / DAOM 197198 / MUCL 43194) TaxID=747089 RepID=A0A2P4PDB9_RHIID|nr:hypothetical protein GLOIN_2v1845965 [Rhizophagus irregularis DAOM 181602=DAOM 197198]POG63379.1 hypothetical protein GLOIN_2v1845965 [Rhizophagus irregularis DAOM 181602=DAOM 197198]|eukprot:XP_025170245.1 hypothetical protein GLOIN_2v1845965 [Rhizophagus irregularis DAOM 181602=DAOM 197198]
MVPPYQVNCTQLHRSVLLNLDDPNYRKLSLMHSVSASCLRQKSHVISFLFIVERTNLICKIYPNLKVDQIFLDDIDIPDIAICGTPELRILRCDLKTHNTVRERIDGCNNYILPNAADYGVFKDYCLTFKANEAIKFTKPEIGGYDEIGFSFYDNTTASEAGTIGIASLTILIIPSDFNPVTNPNKKAISQMDEATLSEFRLQLNFIAGMARYVAVVKFKTSTYRSILPKDARAIFGLEPNYHVTPKTENFINYFPFNSNPSDIPVGTTGYFSVSAGSFIQEQTSEERSNTVLGAIAAAGGAFGVTAGVIVFFFGDSRLSPRGFVHKSVNFLQDSKELFERSRFHPKLDFKFSSINDKDKDMLVDEFRNIRYAVYYHLLYQSNNIVNKMNKVPKGFINKIEYVIIKINIFFSGIKTGFYYWLFNAKYIKECLDKYKKEKLELSSNINEEDKKLLNDEIDKIRHVIDVYSLGKSEEKEKVAKYKYERELKFSDDTKNEDKEELHIISEEDQKLLNDEFRKIRKLIDKHLLDKPDIEEIFDAYNFLKNNNFSKDIKGMGEGDTLQNNDFSKDIKDMDEGDTLQIDDFSKDIKDMDEGVIPQNNDFSKDKKDKKLLDDLFQQISYVIFNYLLDIPKDEEKFNKYKETVQKSNFSTEMNDKDKELLANEFNNIKHVINCHLFNERKNLKIFDKYIKERKLEFSSENMSEKDKKLLTGKFSKIREVIDNFLLNEPTRLYLDLENMNEKDREPLLSYINNHIIDINNEIHMIKRDIDKYILDKV